MAEKETLQRAIDEKRAILDGVDVDVESRMKIMEEYAQMKAEMWRCGIGEKIPGFQRLKDANYNAEEVIVAFANMSHFCRIMNWIMSSISNPQSKCEMSYDLMHCSYCDDLWRNSKAIYVNAKCREICKRIEAYAGRRIQ